ncbi:hypothetical protein [Enterobacter chuandaensis]|uniref:hypothetical protein n=1 Tax=Enterobacter chuandaensis TaxID=2497875 RepID=UPI0020C63709|nr:hypothetical protein [Enterobacter chuandaensis]
MDAVQAIPATTAPRGDGHYRSAVERLLESTTLTARHDRGVLFFPAATPRCCSTAAAPFRLRSAAGRAKLPQLLKTPGHPEVAIRRALKTTTGPLGQGP